MPGFEELVNVILRGMGTTSPYPGSQPPLVPPPGADQPRPETYRDTLHDMAQAPSAIPPKTFAEFVISTLQDPNPLHRAGLPLGVLGRGLDADARLGQGMAALMDLGTSSRAWLSLLSPVLEGVTGRELPGYAKKPLAQIYEENPATAVPSIVAPTPLNLATLGSGTTAKIAQGTGNPVLRKVFEALVPVNRAVEVPIQKGMSGVGSVLKGAANLPGIRRMFQVSGESLSRERLGQVMDVINTMRQQGYRGYQAAAEHIGVFKSKGNGNAELKREWDGLEATVRTADNPLARAYGSIVLNYARAAANQARRDYAVARGEAAQAGELDKQLASSLAANHFDQVRQVQEATKQTIRDFIQASSMQQPVIPTEAWGKLAPALKATLDQFDRRVQQLVKDTAIAAKAERGGDGAASEMIDELYAQRDRQMQAMGQELIDVLEQAFAPFAPTGEGPSWLRAAVGPEAAADFYGRMRGVELNAMGMPTTRLGFVPARLQELMNTTVSGLQRGATRMIGDRRKINDALEAAPLLADAPTMAAKVEKLRALGVLPAGTGPVTGEQLVEGIQTAARAGREVVGDNEFSIIKRVVDKWSSRGFDILNADPLHAATPEVYEAALAKFGKSPGLGGIVGKTLKDTTDFWKTYTLATPKYHILNAISGWIFAGLKGYDPLEIARRQRETLRNIVTHPADIDEGNWLPESSRRFQEVYELQHPHELVTGAYQAAVEVLGGAKRLVSEKMGPVRRAAMGAGMGALTAGPVGAIAGAGLGLAMPAVERVNKLVAWAIESNARLFIWETETAAKALEKLPSFLEETERVLRQGSKVMGPLERPTDWEPLAPYAARPVNLPDSAIQQTLETLRETGGAFGPRQLTNVLLEAGARPDQITHLTQVWTNHLDDASQAGMQASYDVHFNYGKLTTLEESMKQFVPFATWFLRAVPFAAGRVAENPILALAFAHYNSLSNEEVEKAGLPPTWLGYVPTGGFGRVLATAIFGQPAESGWFNPMQAISPFGDMLGVSNRVGQEDTFFGGLRELGRPMGIGLSGPLDYALTAAGVFGGDQPLPNLMRYVDLPSKAVAALPGLAGGEHRADLMGVVQGMGPEMGRETVDALRRALGQDPTSFHRLSIERRLDEMSMEERGKVGDPLYMAAKQDPDSELYRRAEADVYRKEFGQTMSGLFLPAPMRGLTTTEGAIRKEATNLPKGPIDTPEEREAFAAALEAHPVAGAYSNSGGQAQRAELKQALAALQNPVMLFPEAPQSVRDNMTKLWTEYQYRSSDPRGADVRGVTMFPLLQLALERRRALLDNKPILREYIAWRTEHHPNHRGEGEETLIEQFFNERGS